jgi:MSHA pilin protein MshA
MASGGLRCLSGRKISGVPPNIRVRTGSYPIAPVQSEAQPMNAVAAFRHQQGFTLIELTIVIVVVGILMALALARFADVGADARIAKAQSILDAVRSASQVTRAAARARNQIGAIGTVPVDGVSIATNYGYPQALAAGNGARGIAEAAGLDTSDRNNDGVTLTGGAATGGTGLVIEVNGAGTLANCAVSYTAPSAAGAPPTVSIVTTGC